MSDEKIREILIERKRNIRNAERRAETFEILGGLLGWSSLFVIGFMLSVIGG